jgi:hypothetical protein
VASPYRLFRKGDLHGDAGGIFMQKTDNFMLYVTESGASRRPYPIHENLLWRVAGTGVAQIVCAANDNAGQDGPIGTGSP